jgi:hypothetical protein
MVESPPIAIGVGSTNFFKFFFLKKKNLKFFIMNDTCHNMIDNDVILFRKKVRHKLSAKTNVYLMLSTNIYTR